MVRWVKKETFTISILSISNFIACFGHILVDNLRKFTMKLKICGKDAQYPFRAMNCLGDN